MLGTWPENRGRRGREGWRRIGEERLREEKGRRPNKYKTCKNDHMSGVGARQTVNRPILLGDRNFSHSFGDADVFATTTIVLHHLPRPELVMRRNWLPCESEAQSHHGLYLNIMHRTLYASWQAPHTCRCAGRLDGLQDVGVFLRALICHAFPSYS